MAGRLFLNPIPSFPRKRTQRQKKTFSYKLKLKREKKEMRSFFGLIVLTLGLLCSALAVSAQMDGGNPMVGGSPMFKTKNIVENAVNSKDHTTLVAAVQAAGLVDTLKGAGP